MDKPKKKEPARETDTKAGRSVVMQHIQSSNEKLRSAKET